MRLKVCGMKHNIEEVSELKPDYLGFIFYDKSPRNFEGVIPEMDANIKKVGVFVDANIDFIIEKILKLNLDVIQLHGNESSSFILTLKESLDHHDKKHIDIWNVFSIKDTFDFNMLKPYEAIVDAYLFDTKGAKKGGNGVVFDWDVLAKYPSNKPFILSGGIGIDEIQELNKIRQTRLPILAIDVNSKFEKEPGLKNIETLTFFKTKVFSTN